MMDLTRLSRNQATSYRWCVIWAVCIFTVLMMLSVCPRAVAFEIDQQAALHMDVSVQEVLRNAPDNQDIKVFVEMKERADLDQAKADAQGSSHHEKQDVVQRKAVIGALQETATESQAALLEYLKAKKDLHEVSEYESFYIINVIMVVAKPQVIQEIASMDGVEAVHSEPRITQVKPIPDKESSKRKRRSLESEDGVEWGLKLMSVPRVWDELHITGSGVTVGILDSGTNYNHPALLHQFKGYNPATKSVDNKELYKDFVEGDRVPQAQEALNHGTHVAGTICGSDGEYNRIGVAPSARFIAGRVIGDQEGGAEDILRGAQWMLAPDGHAEQAPRVINNSWGGPNDDDPWFMAIADKWRAAGIVPVFAAGNTPGGKVATDGSIANPGNQPNVFAVGAVDINQQLAPFSQVGPSPFDPQRIKPDVSAPGVHVRSCLATGGYTSWNGTSMAAPHVTGVIALMLEANPRLTVDEIEQILKDTAVSRTDMRYPSAPNMGYGYGIVNAYDAVRAAQDRGAGKQTDERMQITGHVLTHGVDNTKPQIEAQLSHEGYTKRSYPITATISDDTSVTSAFVAYRADSESAYTLVALTRNEGDVKKGLYQAVIPGEALSSRHLDIRLIATDFSSQDEISSLTGTTQIEEQRLIELAQHPHVCVTNTHDVTILPGVIPGSYNQDFEKDCAGWIFAGELGGAKAPSDWGWGSPTLAKEPKPYGSKLLGIKLGAHQPTKHLDSYAYMPPLDLSDSSLKQVNLNFDEYLGFDGVCDARIQIAHSDQGPWKDLDEKLIPPTSSPAWHHVSYNLDEYVGSKDPIHIRWYFHFPDHGEGVGWYIDNVAVGLGDTSAPSAVKLYKAHQYMEGIELSWQAVPENDVTSYVVYRGTHADEKSNDLSEIAQISPDAAVLRYTDTNLSEGSFVYTVRARDAFGNESPVEQVVKVPYKPLQQVHSYAFDHDDQQWTTGIIEGESQVWECGVIPRYADENSVFSLREAQLGLDEHSKQDRVWATRRGDPIPGSDLYDGRLHSRIHCYVQSPEFTLPQSDNSFAPVLSFASYNAMHYLDEYQRDLETVEIVTSSNHESHVLIAASEIMNVDSKFKWQHLQKSLEPYAGQSISLRFVMKTGERSLFDAYELGWYFDNVLVGESPKTFEASPLHLEGVTRSVSAVTSRASSAPIRDSASVQPAATDAAASSSRDSAQPAPDGAHVRSMPAPPQNTVPLLGGYVDISDLGRTQQTVDTDGSFSCKVASGTWKVTARAYGYVSQSIEVSESTHHDFILEPAARGVITGRVLDKEGNPVAHAHVRLVEDSNVAPVACDENGVYRIECFEGSYHLRSYAAGFEAQTQEITLTKEQNDEHPLVVNFNLTSVIGDKETISYDNDSCKTSLIFAGKDKGAAVRFYPLKQDGRLVEASFYVEDVPQLETDDMTVLVLQEDEHQRLRTLARVPDAKVVPGQWNTVDLSAFNIKTNKAFYIAVVQNYPSGKTYGVGIDTQGLDKDAIKNSFLYDGSFTQASKANVVGAFMIRATMVYSKDARPNNPEPDPNAPIPPAVSADDIFEWEPTSDGSAYIVKKLIGPLPDNREIVVPQTHEGKPVVEIGDHAFAWKYLTKLVIPEGVIKVGKGAFSAAVKQEGTLHIPSTTTQFGPGAFSTLNGITITGMEGVTSVSSGMFAEMWSSTIHLPHAQDIADDAFGGSAGYNAEYNKIITEQGNPYNLSSKDGLYLVNPAQLIVDVQIAETEEIDQTITYIGEENTSTNYDRSLPASSFYQVGQVITVKAPRNVLVVYEEEQKQLKLPAPISHTTFVAHRIEAATRAPLVEGEKPVNEAGGVRAEQGLAVVGYSLPGTQITVSYKNLDTATTWEGTADEDGLYAVELTHFTPLAGAQLTVAYTTPSGKSVEKTVSVVQKAHDNQLYLMDVSAKGILRRYLGNDPKITIPISAQDFRGADRTVKEIGPLAFEGLGITQVSGLKENEHITRVHMGAFAHNKLESLELGNNVTSVDSYAFAYNNLRAMKLPNLLHKLGDYSFAHNSLEQFDPGTYTGHFGKYCLAHNSLKQMVIPKRVEEIGEGAFAHNKLEHLVFLNAQRDDIDGVSGPTRSVDRHMLRSVLSDRIFRPMTGSGHSHVLTHIQKDTFAHNNLVDVVLPAEVSSVDETAFAKNGRLVNVITNNGGVKDAILEADSGHIVNGVAVTVRFLDDQGKEIRSSIQYVGKNGMTERKGSKNASDYYRSGESIHMKAPLLRGYEAVTEDAVVKAQIGAPNEMSFTYRALSGNPDPDPTPIPVPDPDPSPIPDPEPTPDPAPQPEPAPAPDPGPHPGGDEKPNSDGSWSAPGIPLWPTPYPYDGDSIALNPDKQKITSDYIHTYENLRKNLLRYQGSTIFSEDRAREDHASLQPDSVIGILKGRLPVTSDELSEICVWVLAIGIASCCAWSLRSAWRRKKGL